MNRKIFRGAALFYLLLAGAAVRPAWTRPPPSPASLTVRLYNYAGAPAELVSEATSVAQEIFWRAGIATAWIDCRTPSAQPGPAACDEMPGISVLRLNLLSRPMARRMGVDAKAFGIAFPSKTGFGLLAAVFYHRVVELERDRGLKASLGLGHVLAHEVGHLLLGFRSHTPTGLMSAHWDHTAVIEIKQGSLIFSEGQIRRMRRQITARFEAERSDLMMASSGTNRPGVR